jgi:hypothetical protein
MMMKSKRNRLVWHVARAGDIINTYNFLVGKPEGKIPLRRRWRRWENNVKMSGKERGNERGTGLIWLRIGSSAWFF